MKSLFGKSMKLFITKLTILVFVFSSLFYPITPNTISYISPREVSAATISSGIADKPNLGEEEYWNFFTDELGGGWIAQVNTATGNMMIKKSLVSVPGRGLPLTEGVIYNSMTQQNRGLGHGWTLTNNLYLQENADGSVTFKDEDSTNHQFVRQSDGTYVKPPGIHLNLTKVQNGIFTMMDKDFSSFHFENGKLSYLMDEKGNPTSVSYDTSGKLSRITDPSNRSLLYSYNTNGWLTSLTDPANRQIRFNYDTNGRLIAVIDARNQQTKFEYDTNNRIIAFIDANGRKTTFTYDAQGKIIKILDARSNTTTQYATSFTYDNATLTTTITDPAGKTSIYTHNANGNLVKHTNGAGNVFTYEWNANEIVKSTDSKGSTSLQYDDNGNVTQVSDTISSAETATTSIKYDSKDNPIEITDPIQNKSIYRYDSNSNEISSINPHRLEADGKTYDANGNVTSSTDLGAPTYNLLENGSFERLNATGDFVAWYKGGNGSVSSDSNAYAYGTTSAKITNVNNTDFTYLYSDATPVTAGQKLTFSSLGRLENITGSVGADIGLQFYDANFNFVSATYSNSYKGTGNVNFVLTATAPANSAYVVAVVELDQASGSVWFDGAQLESPLKSDEGHILTDYDYVDNSSFEWGGYLWSAGGTSGATSIATDAKWAGNRSAKINLSSTGDAWIGSIDIPVRQGEPLTLSGFIKTVGLTGAGARLEIEYYDSSGAFLGYAATKLQTGTEDFTRYAVSTTPPANATKARIYGVVWSSSGTAYFDNLKLTRSGTTLYGYDSTGNYLTAKLDVMGNLTQFTYDQAGNNTSITDPKGYKTSFTYDANNNLTSVTDPVGKVTYYEYDPVNFQVAIRDPRSASSADNTYKTTFNYNELNQIINMTDPLGNKITKTYDQAGNLESVTYPNGNKITYTYDAANRISTANYSGTTQKWTYSYDTAGNLVQVTDEKNQGYRNSYDGANRLTQFTNPFGYQLNYQLDKAGNVVSVTDSNNKRVTYTYGTDGRLISMTDSSGRVTQINFDGAGRPFEVIRGNNIKSVQVFDRLGRVIQIADPGNPNGAVLYYTYDNNGNITEIRGEGRQTFTYDALNRLISWTDEAGNVTAYQYDAIGNLLKKGDRTFTYNAANQITNPGFTYDKNGNLTSDGKFNYSYNHDNQLVKVTNVSNGSTVATYSYDHRGLRISKTTSSGTVYYHWDDGERLVRETDGNGQIIAQFTYNTEGQLVAIEKGGKVYYIHTNHRGDILGVTDENRNQVATYQYDPWGQLISKTGTFDIPFRYAGYYYDTETGLYYLKARYYSPELGRFLTADEISFGDLDAPQSLNLYAYAEGNPIKYTDPEGTWVWLAAKAIYGGITGYKEATARGYTGWKAVGYVAASAALETVSLGKVVKKASSVVKASKAPTQLQRGREFEKKVIKEMGLTKNTKKIGNSIPDSLSRGRITEIKDTKYAYNSKQFRDYAKANKPIDLIVRPHTKVSKPLQKTISTSKGRIIRK